MWVRAPLPLWIDELTAPFITLQGPEAGVVQLYPRNTHQNGTSASLAQLRQTYMTSSLLSFFGALYLSLSCFICPQSKQ